MWVGLTSIEHEQRKVIEILVHVLLLEMPEDNLVSLN